jgi:hypothetical protein
MKTMYKVVKKMLPVIMVALWMSPLTSMTAHSGSSGESEKIPQGTWVFESISAFENNEQLPSFSVEKLDFGLPIEIEVKSDEVVFVKKTGTNTVSYNSAVNGNLLCFFICAEWSIVDGMLQLQWFQSPKEGEPGDEKTIIVKFSYKL